MKLKEEYLNGREGPSHGGDRFALGNKEKSISLSRLLGMKAPPHSSATRHRDLFCQIELTHPHRMEVNYLQSIIRGDYMKPICIYRR
jgi:hypothetical protein